MGSQGKVAIIETALVHQMIGRELSQYHPAHAQQARGEERLRVRGLSSPGRFADISFSVYAGEVVGLPGLVGAGRSEIAQAIFGLDDTSTGEVYVRGTRVVICTPRDAMREGIGFVPEDRKKQGLVLGMENRENATLPTLERFARAGWVDQDAEVSAVTTSFERVLLRSKRDAITSSLSGGNQQKVVLSKWLTAESNILLLDEPTRGVDVGAKSELHAWIDEKASQGAAVLLISSELPELLNVSTRILVLRDGRLRGEVSRADGTCCYA